AESVRSLQGRKKTPGVQSIPGFTITDLGTLGGDESFALAINRNGEIVGEADTTSGDKHGFIWRKGNMHDLGEPGDNYFTSATWANDKGKVIGSAFLIAAEQGGGGETIMWNSGTIRNIEDGSGWRWVSVDRINNSGLVIGYAENEPAMW